MTNAYCESLAAMRATREDILAECTTLIEVKAA